MFTVTLSTIGVLIALTAAVATFVKALETS